jgi:hypothetical protein
LKNIWELSYLLTCVNVFAFLSCLSGCAWLDKSEHTKIVGDYSVGWNDLERNRCIYKTITNCDGCSEVIVDSYVFAVGHSEDFIFAKQHPGMDTERTNYFIIDLKANENAKGSGVFGPLSEKEFDSLTVRLKISKIHFDLNYLSCGN